MPGPNPKPKPIRNSRHRWLPWSRTGRFHAGPLGVLAAALIFAAGCRTGPAPNAPEEMAPADPGQMAQLQAENRQLQQRVQELEAEVARLRAEAEAPAEDPGEDPAGDPDADPAARPATLIDPRYPRVAAGEPGWDYQRETAADFDGDGTEERLVVLARVGRTAEGDYVWDDGQPWNVYVGEPDGTRTYLYARWVQLGDLEAMVTDDQEVLILERQGAGVALYRVRYRGPGESEALELARQTVLRYVR